MKTYHAFEGILLVKIYSISSTELFYADTMLIDIQSRGRLAFWNASDSLSFLLVGRRKSFLSVLTDQIFVVRSGLFALWNCDVRLGRGGRENDLRGCYGSFRECNVTAILFIIVCQRFDVHWDNFTAICVEVATDQWDEYRCRCLPHLQMTYRWQITIGILKPARCVACTRSNFDVCFLSEKHVSLATCLMSVVGAFFFYRIKIFSYRSFLANKRIYYYYYLKMEFSSIMYGYHLVRMQKRYLQFLYYPLQSRHSHWVFTLFI